MRGGWVYKGTHCNYQISHFYAPDKTGKFEDNKFFKIFNF